MQSKLTPPSCKKVPYESVWHGQTLKDDYFWLREKGNAEVIQYLEEENRYTDSVLKPTEEFQKKLYDEMLSRIKETDLSVPVKKGGFEYYSRTEKGKQYSISCRKKIGSDQEEVILDMNALAEGHDYFDLGIMEISPNHKLLAYSTDTSGAEIYTLFVKDLETGQLLEDRIENTGSSLEWAEDNQTFFYSILDHAKRPFKLLRHRLGTLADEDVEVFHEEDERFFLSVDKTKDRKYLLVDLNSKNTSEVFFLSADQPEGEWVLFSKREEGIEYWVEHHGEEFLVMTNADAVNFKLMKASSNETKRTGWKEFYAHREDVKLEGLTVFKDYFVIYERDRGLTNIRILDLENKTEKVLDFDEAVYTSWAGNNPEYVSDTLRFGYSSLLTPSSVYDYTFKTGQRTLLKQQEVLGGYDPHEYASERLYAKSHDGIEIPISIAYKKDLVKDGQAPLFLYGYGSYGISMDPTFSSVRLSLLNRGFVFAIAHIRGGGDLGRPWYDSGKLNLKQNTFEDFIACGEYLVNEKFTSPERMVTSGGSAGGLLMGAVLNKRPDLFHAAILDVPFVDALNTMLDPNLPLTVTEYDEWGNPQEKEVFDYMKTYSPYDNIERKNYPHMLVTGGLNDPRVQYWEPAKWTAKLREYKTDENLLLLKIHMGAGHGGPSGRYEAIKEMARDYAFFIFTLEMNLE